MCTQANLSKVLDFDHQETFLSSSAAISVFFSLSILRGETSTISPQASLLEQMGHFFLPLELGWHEQTVNHLVTRPFWPIRKLEPIALSMKQFNWIIALSLDGCEQLMKHFDWLIALGLIRCGQLME